MGSLEKMVYGHVAGLTGICLFSIDCRDPPTAITERDPGSRCSSGVIFSDHRRCHKAVRVHDPDEARGFTDVGAVPFGGGGRLNAVV
eukprot:CAMPEP_0194273394 /NCGR_PEP_ID=MMETSP0169-20130528/6746_1 /TAXON_ID=218684 /ORGANISM="Corethron pennatum, Strain L29A3" /LENGTH=86 /DNA_ID=CAMNT_0039016339 /DNA_START=554 /DNA_END=810 /DNA_ORIENTATION=+